MIFQGGDPFESHDPKSLGLKGIRNYPQVIAIKSMRNKKIATHFFYCTPNKPASK